MSTFTQNFYNHNQSKILENDVVLIQYARSPLSSKLPNHSALMVILIKLLQERKQLLQHECLTPIESGITSSQILQIQNQLD